MEVVCIWFKIILGLNASSGSLILSYKKVKSVYTVGLQISKGRNVPLYFSASLTIHSISVDKGPLSLVIVMRFDLPVVLSDSDAETFKIPLASMSKVTSI